MADIADLAQEAIEAEEAERAAKLKPYDVPPGTPGECDQCGRLSPRLLLTNAGYVCAPCREPTEERIERERRWRIPPRDQGGLSWRESDEE